MCELNEKNKKVCIKCNIEKKLNEFNKRTDSKDGHINTCRKCESIYRKKYYEENKELAKKYYEENKEHILYVKKAHYDKNIESYKIKHSNYYEENKENILEVNKKYYEENKEQINTRRKSYCEENSEKIKQNKKRYYEENKEHIAECGVKYRKDNHKEIAIRKKEYYMNNRHIHSWRDILRASLKRMNTEKNDSTINLLGYSADDLKLHMESLFTEGMSWDNHGEWHIDHKIPVSSFKPDTPMCIVNSLDNLQPLWSEENLSKGNKIYEEYKTMEIYIKYCI